MHWIDPDHLPEITGIVDQLLVNKHGEADGFLLTDGEEVHVPPHLSARLLRDVLPGSQVKVRGVRPRGVRMVAAVAIDTPKGRILDDGPDARENDDAFEKAKHGPMTVQGIVKRSIHGPKGETRGAVLEDGRIIRLPPHEGREIFRVADEGRKAFRGRRRCNDIVRHSRRSTRDRRFSRNDEGRWHEEAQARTRPQGAEAGRQEARIQTRSERRARWLMA